MEGKDNLSANELFYSVGQVKTGKNPPIHWERNWGFVTLDILKENKNHEKIAKNLIDNHYQCEASRNDLFFKEKKYERGFWYAIDHAVGNVTTPGIKYMAEMSQAYLDKKAETKKSISDLEKYSIIPEIKDSLDIFYKFDGEIYSAPDVLIERLKVGDIKTPSKLKSFLEATLLREKKRQGFTSVELKELTDFFKGITRGSPEHMLGETDIPHAYKYGGHANDIFEGKNKEEVPNFFHNLYEVIKNDK